MRNEVASGPALAAFRRMLLEEQARLRSGRLADDINPESIDRGDEADQASALQLQFVSISYRSMGARKLRDIEAAIERLESEEYGLCVECEAPISVSRLQAIPWTAHCIRCQERLDRIPEN